MEVADSPVAASLQDKPQGMLKVLARLQVAEDLTRHRPWGIQGIGEFFNVVDVSFNNMGISIVMGDPQVMLGLFPWENPNLIAGWFKASPISGNLHMYQLIDGVWRAWGNMVQETIWSVWSLPQNLGPHKPEPPVPRLVSGSFMW